MMPTKPRPPSQPTTFHPRSVSTSLVLPICDTPFKSVVPLVLWSPEHDRERKRFCPSEQQNDPDWTFCRSYRACSPSDKGFLPLSVSFQESQKRRSEKCNWRVTWRSERNAGLSPSHYRTCSFREVSDTSNIEPRREHGSCEPCVPNTLASGKPRQSTYL